MNRRMALSVGGIAVLIVLAWWMLIWKPAGNDLAAAEKRADRANEQISQMQVQLSRLEVIRDELPALQSQVQNLRTAIPDSPGLADFLLAAHDAEAASGLEFLTATANEPAPGPVPGLQVIDVQLTGNGGYYQVLDFVNRLQAMHRIMSIGNITVVSANTEDTEQIGPPNLQLTISGRLYMTTPDTTGEPTAPEASPTSDAGAGA
ncbi:MAG TPA: hypothetical protein ENI86_01820 [Acidimicrobiales bacterium]|nr:hypothetical protein [Acidimicrobiales bacterium]